MCLVLCWGYRRWVREPHHKKLDCLPAFGFTCPVMSWRRFSQTQMETFLDVFRPWHHYVIQVLSLDLNRSSWRPSGHLHWTFPDGTFLYFFTKWFILIPKRAIGIASREMCFNSQKPHGAGSGILLRWVQVMALPFARPQNSYVMTLRVNFFIIRRVGETFLIS